MVIRGSAGSGKTTVALHRFSYLTFEDPKHFAPENMMFMVWGKAMRDYVGHVLPTFGDFGDCEYKLGRRGRAKCSRQHFPRCCRH